MAGWRGVSRSVSTSCFTSAQAVSLISGVQIETMYKGWIFPHPKKSSSKFIINFVIAG